MSLARRVRAGIALHAGVNVVFAAAAVLTAAGGSVVAEASGGDGPTAESTLAAPPDGLPIHAVTPAHPLAATGDAGGTGVSAAADSTAVGTAAPDAERGADDDEAAAPTATTATTNNRADADAAVRRVDSTGYCLRGTTASGVQVGHGQVAMNGVPLGTEWLVHDGPQAGRTFEVTDRIGHSTEFDIWFADCDDAVVYGRRTITIEQVG